MADIRVLIVAADPLARAGLATLLSEQPGCRVVGQVSGGETLAAELDVFEPDVIIWDLGWEPEESLNLLSDMALELDEIRPVIVALLPDEELAAHTWSAGVRGLLFRDVTPGRLIAAVTAAVNGLATVESELMSYLVPSGPLEEPLPAEELTPREIEVLQLLAEGLSNRAIGQRLEISEHTVKIHVNAIMGKLGAQSRTAAVVRATRLGLILL